MTTLGTSSRTAAPGGLGHVQALINSVDLEESREELRDPEALSAWLIRNDLPGGDTPLTKDDLRSVLEVREALRALAGANNGEPLEETVVATLNRIASRAQLRIHFDPNGATRLEPAEHGVTAALAVILSNVETAMVEGSWQRLKTCRNDTCRWAFYDRSKNRSGAWCTMAECGGKLKARAYRQRQKAAQ